MSAPGRIRGQTTFDRLVANQNEQHQQQLLGGTDVAALGELVRKRSEVRNLADSTVTHAVGDTASLLHLLPQFTRVLPQERGERVVSADSQCRPRHGQVTHHLAEVTNTRTVTAGPDGGYETAPAVSAARLRARQRRGPVEDDDDDEFDLDDDEDAVEGRVRKLERLLSTEKTARIRCGTSQHGLSSKKMGLITSDCGTMRSLSIKWP